MLPLMLAADCFRRRRCQYGTQPVVLPVMLMPCHTLIFCRHAAAFTPPIAATLLFATLPSYYGRLVKASDNKRTRIAARYSYGCRYAENMNIKDDIDYFD